MPGPSLLRRSFVIPEQVRDDGGGTEGTSQSCEKWLNSIRSAMSYSREDRMDASDIDVDWVALVGSFILVWGGLALGLPPIIAVSATLLAVFGWRAHRRKQDARLRQ